MSASTLVVDARRARVKARGPFFAQICVPINGPWSLTLRRHISAELNLRARDRPGTRRAAVTLSRNHALISLAGTREAVEHWVTGARVAGLLADVTHDVQRLSRA